MNNGTSGTVAVYPEADTTSADWEYGYSIIVGSKGPMLHPVDSGEINTIVSVITTGNTTVAITNSANIKATDILVDGVYYYYKIPLSGLVPTEVVDIELGFPVRFTYDSQYLYLEEDNIVEVTLEDGTMIAEKPVEVFLNESYYMDNRYYADDKKYSIRSYYSNMKVIFNLPNVHVVSNGSLVRVRNFSNIIHIDPFILGSEKFMKIGRSTSTTYDPLLPSFSSSELNNFFDLDNEDNTLGPFIYPDNTIEFSNDTVFILMFILSGVIYSTHYNVDGRIVYDDNPGGSQLFLSVKITRPSERLVAARNTIYTTSETRFCGAERLSVQHGSTYQLYEPGQLFIPGVRSGDLVQFSLSVDLPILTSANIKVVDVDGVEQTAYIFENAIFAISEDLIGVSYNNKTPGVFV